LISFPPIFTVHDDYARFNEVYNRAQDLKIGAKAKITYKTVDGSNYAIEIEQS